MAKEKIKWHPAFAAAIQLEFKEYKDYLEFSIEHQLTDEPLKIDIVVIKKLEDIEISKKIGRILKKYNVFEYKSPTDYISIDDYYKVKAYAYLYKALSKGTNSIDISDLTITLTSNRYPKKLIDHLKLKHNVTINKIDSGIYYIENTDIKTQLIVTKDLSDEESAYLKLLQTEHENKSILKNWLDEYLSNIKDPLYAVIMNVLSEANPNEVMEVYKVMGKAQLSNENMEFLMDMIQKLNLDKKIKEQGIEEGIERGIEKGLEIGAKNERKRIIEEKIQKALSKGYSLDIITEILGVSVEDVEEVKKKM